MFKPTMKRRHLEALMRMAEESGRDAQSIYEELLDAATSSEPPPSPTPKAAPEQTPATATDNANATAGTLVPGGKIGKVTIDPRVVEQRRRESARTEDDQNAASASNETDNAPEHLMKGAKENPLRRWAKGTSENGEDPAVVDPKKQKANDEDERKAALRRKHLAYAGKAQRRG